MGEPSKSYVSSVPLIDRAKWHIFTSPAFTIGVWRLTELLYVCRLAEGYHSWQWILLSKHMAIPMCSYLDSLGIVHDDVIKWKHFPRYWPFVRGIHRSSEFPVQRPVTRSFRVFFDLHPNKRLRKQWWGWWFETPSRPVWCHCNVISALHCGGIHETNFPLTHLWQIHVTKRNYPKMILSGEIGEHSFRNRRSDCTNKGTLRRKSFPSYS